MQRITTIGLDIAKSASRFSLSGGSGDPLAAVSHWTAEPKRLRKKVAIVLVDNNGLARGTG